MENRNEQKHTITANELNFLIELQNELNTQDTVGQADPRFWVVSNYQKRYVDEDFGEEEELVCINDTSNILAHNLDEAVKYFKEYIAENYEDDERYQYIFTKDRSYRFKIIDTHTNKVELDKMHISSIKTLIETLEDADIIPDSYKVIYYCNEHYICPDTLFLTLNGCKKHIERNKHNYSASAHPYAMTAFRSPEVEKLWDILQKVDWKQIMNSQR